MISGDEIKQLIQQPQDINKSQLTEIEELIEKYPYSSSLYLLQMIALKKTNDLNFESKLKVAASHVSDREHLHELLEKPVKVTAEDLVEETVVEEVEEPIVAEEVVQEEEIVQEEIIEEEEDTSAKEETVVKEEVAEEEPELSQLEESIMSSVVESALNMEFEEEMELDNDEVPEEDEDSVQLDDEEIELEDQKEREKALAFLKKLEEEEEKAAKAAKKKAKKKAKKEAKAKKAEMEASMVKPEDMSFIEWLKFKQSIIEGEPIKKEKKKAKKKKKKTTKAKSDKDIVQETSNMSKNEINELLDKFIEEEPTISSPSKDFYKATENAKKSVEESVDIVSETLAKIHVMQGNYGKAINTYKQLILLYPEKKAFFASQIEKIEEKLK